MRSSDWSSNVCSSDLKDTSVNVAVPHYGVYDFAGATGLKSAIAMRDRFLGPRVLKKKWREAPDDFEAASPLLRIKPGAPDFFVMHGTNHPLAAVTQARRSEERRVGNEGSSRVNSLW